MSKDLLLGFQVSNAYAVSFRTVVIEDIIRLAL